MTSRPLTKGEIALARTVFGDSIEYGTVYVSDSKFTGFHPEGVAMAPNGNLFMPGCYSDDYSAERVYTQSLFIHEMTHVWQYQNKVLAPMVEAIKLNVKFAFNYLAAYNYTLDGKKDLVDYNMEQQASIVQDWFAQKHGAFNPLYSSCQNKCTDAERQDLFDKILAKFVSNPEYARRDEFPVAMPGGKKKNGPPHKK
jgi:hypothetical protein